MKKRGELEVLPTFAWAGARGDRCAVRWRAPRPWPSGLAEAAADVQVVDGRLGAQTHIRLALSGLPDSHILGPPLMMVKLPACETSHPEEQYPYSLAYLPTVCQMPPTSWR